MRIAFLTTPFINTPFWYFCIDNHNILWYIRIIIVLCASFAGLLSAPHTLLSLYRGVKCSHMKPWAVTPACENNYAVRKFLTVFSTCTPLCRRAKICLYLRHRAFRSEQSRHRWKDYYRSFALTKNSKYVKMRPPGKAGRPSEWNNTANAGRIVRSRNGRKILPAFLLTVFVAALATAAVPQEKESAPKSLRRRSEKRSFTKSRQDGAA